MSERRKTKASRVSAALAVALLATMWLSGCGPISFIVEKTVTLFTPPAKSKPLFSLEGKSVLLLVDPARSRMAVEQPRATLSVAEAVAKELTDRHAAGRIVDPHDVEIYAQQHPGFSELSVTEIAQPFKVDTVLHLILNDYQLEKTTAGDSFAAYANLSVRVIDVRSGMQVFPGRGGDHIVQVRSPAGIMANNTSEAERVLLDALARKVGKVFVSYVIEEEPLRQEVQ